MSTNGIIARAGKDEGTFDGRYHHWDSYPTGLGNALVELYRLHFKCDLDAMLKVLIDEHKAGWSNIVNCDFKLKPGYKTMVKVENEPKQPQCYCHGERHEKAQRFTEKDTDACVQWAYVFEKDADGKAILHVLYPEKHEGGEYAWKEAGRIELDSNNEINWDKIECGENFERCCHVASYHKLVDSGCRLGTQTFLGQRPLDFHDVIGFMINGKRYSSTGCGGNSDYYNSASPSNRFPSNSWIADVKASNGRVMKVAVAQLVDGEYRPIPGGPVWIYPPTAVHSKETQARA